MPVNSVAGVLDAATVIVAALMVVGSMASLKVTLTDLLVHMPVAVSAGLLDTIAGGVVSTPLPVVNIHVKSLTKALPERSVAAVVTVAVYVVPALRVDGVVGVKTALFAPAA